MMTSEQRHREAHEGRLVVMDEPSKQAEALQVTAREGPATYYPGCGSRSRPLRVHRAVRCDHCWVRNGPGLGGELPMRSQPDTPRSNEG